MEEPPNNPIQNKFRCTQNIYAKCRFAPYWFICFTFSFFRSAVLCTLLLLVEGIWLQWIGSSFFDKQVEISKLVREGTEETFHFLDNSEHMHPFRHTQTQTYIHKPRERTSPSSSTRFFRYRLFFSRKLFIGDDMSECACASVCVCVCVRIWVPTLMHNWSTYFKQRYATRWNGTDAAKLCEIRSTVLCAVKDRQRELVNYYVQQLYSLFCENYW